MSSLIFVKNKQTKRTIPTGFRIHFNSPKIGLPVKLIKIDCKHKNQNENKQIFG